MEFSQVLLLWCGRCRESWQRLRHDILHSYLLKIAVPCSTTNIAHNEETGKCTSWHTTEIVEAKEEKCECNTNNNSNNCDALTFANTTRRGVRRVELSNCIHEHAAQMHTYSTFLECMRFTALTHSIRTFCLSPVLHGISQASSKEENSTTIHTNKNHHTSITVEHTEKSRKSRLSNNDTHDDKNKDSCDVKQAQKEVESEHKVNDDGNEFVDLFSEQDLIRLHKVDKSDGTNVDNDENDDDEVEVVNIEIEQMSDTPQIQHIYGNSNKYYNDQSARLQNKEDDGNTIAHDELNRSPPSSSFSFTSSSTGGGGAVVEEVTEVDSFARAKVTNFVQHLISSGQVSCKDVLAYQSNSDTNDMNSNNSNTSDNFTLHINVREVESNSNNSIQNNNEKEQYLPTQFHARFRLPLPECYGERYAEGLANNCKDAELVAAMHAIRVINTLGLPLFQLASRQSRHAQAERAAGRWAPMPNDLPKPPSTPSPLPLQLVSGLVSHSTTNSNTSSNNNNLNMDNSMKGSASSTMPSFKMGKNRKIKQSLFSSEQLSTMHMHNQFTSQNRWETRGIHFIQVQHGACSPLLYTLPSPYFFDHKAHARIRAFFTAYKRNLRTTVYIAPIHKIQKRRERWMKAKRDSTRLIHPDREIKNTNKIDEDSGGANSQSKKPFRIADLYPHRESKPNYFAGSRSGKKWNHHHHNNKNKFNDRNEDNNEKDELNKMKSNLIDKDDEEEGNEMDGAGNSNNSNNNTKSDNGEHYENYDEMPLYLTRILLPLPQRFGFREAIGKGPTAYESTVLACMHAELIIDTVGLALFPESKERQAIHAEECRRVGRWCAEPLSSEYRYNAPSPPALELSTSLDPALQLTLNENEINTSNTIALSSSPSTTNANTKLDKQNIDVDGMSCNEKNNTNVQSSSLQETNSPLSLHNIIESESGSTKQVIASAEVRRGGEYDCFESLLIEHSKAIREYTHTIDVPRAEHSARIVFRAYMQQFESASDSNDIHKTEDDNNKENNDTNEKEDPNKKQNKAHLCSSSRSKKHNIYQSSNKYYSFYTEKIGTKGKEVVRASITVPLVATDVVKEMIRKEHARLAEHEQCINNKEESSTNNNDQTNTDQQTCTTEMNNNDNAEAQKESKVEEKEAVPLLKVDQVQVTDRYAPMTSSKGEEDRVKTTLKSKSHTLLSSKTNVQECMPRERETFVALGIGKTEIEAQTLAAMYALIVLDRLNRLHGPFVWQHRNLRKEIAWWLKSTLPGHRRIKMGNTCNIHTEDKDDKVINNSSNNANINENTDSIVNSNSSEEVSEEVLLPSALQTYREGELLSTPPLSSSLSDTSHSDEKNNNSITNTINNSSSRCWPPVLRCIGHHVSRVVVPGIRTEEIHAQKARWNRFAPNNMCRNVTDLYAKDEYMLSSLHENRSKLHRDVWSIDSDYLNRIIISPFVKPENSRNYVHTLPGVRSPDLFAVNRLTDYLERHGKSVESAVITRGVRERVTLKRKNVNSINGKNNISKYKDTEEEDYEEDMSDDQDEDEDDENDDDDDDEEEEENSVGSEEFYTKDVRLYVVRALLPLPAHIHVTNEELLENSIRIADSCSLKINHSTKINNDTVKNELQFNKECTEEDNDEDDDDEDMDAEDDFTHVPGTCVAQGEAYDPLTALTLCAMHAELLLDALGLPMYDHPVLQRKHSDTARTLGRWAPLSIHGNRPPPSLGPVQIPHPLRKPLARSTIWLSYVKERNNAREESELKNKKTHDVQNEEEEKEKEDKADTEKEKSLSSASNKNILREKEGDHSGTMTRTSSTREKEENNAQIEHTEMQENQQENSNATNICVASAFGTHTKVKENVKQTSDVEINIIKDKTEVQEEEEKHIKMESCKSHLSTNKVASNDKDDDNQDGEHDDDDKDDDEEEEEKDENEDDDDEDEESAEKATLPTDDELCNISKLRPIHPTEVFLNASRHITYFFRCRGIDFARVIRQYTVDEPPYGRVHRSIVTLPLPDKFGVRYAVGVASNKRRSYVLCAMHATQILDALNIAIYTGRKQDMYARLGELKGRPAPRQNVAIKEANTPSPSGLVCLDNATLLNKPSIPVKPSMSKIVHDHREWEFYVKRCNGYMQQAETINHTHSLTTLKQAYRRGIEVEDHILTQVETRELDRFALNRLKTLTMRTRLPEPGEFSVNGFNSPPNRVYLAVANVAGTPYEARGWGKAHKESVSRAAMMYEMIIQTVVVQNTPKQFAHLLSPPLLPSRWRSNVHNNTIHSSTGIKTINDTMNNKISIHHHNTNSLYTSLSTSSMLSDGQCVLLDSTKHELNAHGKMLALALFAATTPPFEALRITRRDRKLSFGSASKGATRGSKSEGASLAMTIRVEMSSEDGLRKVGKGESIISITSNNSSSSVIKALTLATQDLYTQLQRRNQFQALCRTLQFYFNNVQVSMLGLPHDNHKIQNAFEHLHSAITHSQTNCGTHKHKQNASVSESSLSTCSHETKQTEIIKQLCLLDLWSDDGFFSTAKTQLLLQLTESVIDPSPNSSQLSSKEQQKILTTSSDSMFKINTLQANYTIDTEHSKYSTLMKMGLVHYVAFSDATRHNNNHTHKYVSSSSLVVADGSNINNTKQNNYNKPVLYPTLHGILVSFLVQCIPSPEHSSSSSELQMLSKASKASSPNYHFSNIVVERGAMLPLQLAKLLLAGLLWHIPEEAAELVACLLYANECALLWQIYISLINERNDGSTEYEQSICAPCSVDMVSFMCNCLYHNNTNMGNDNKESRCKQDSFSEHIKKSSGQECQEVEGQQENVKSYEQAEWKCFEKQMERFRNEVKKTASVIMSRMRSFRANCSQHHVTSLDELLGVLEEKKVHTDSRTMNEATRRARLLQAVTFATFPYCMYVNPIATTIPPMPQQTQPVANNTHNNNKNENKEIISTSGNKVFIGAALTSAYSDYKTNNSSYDASNNNTNATVKNAKEEENLKISMLPVEYKTCSMHTLLDECETSKAMFSEQNHQQQQQQSVKGDNNNKQLFCASSSVYAHFDLHLHVGPRKCKNNDKDNNNSIHEKIYIGALVSPLTSVLAATRFTSDIAMAVSEETPLIAFMYKGTVAVPLQRGNDVVTLRELQREVERTMHMRLCALPDKVQTALDELLLMLTDQYVYSPLDNRLSCNGVK